MTKRKAFFINSTLREVIEMEISTLADLQALVGGYIERGCTLKNGDDVYVNEEGLLGCPEHFFFIGGSRSQPFAGNGVVVREYRPAKSTVEELNQQIVFMNIKDVGEWIKDEGNQQD